MSVFYNIKSILLNVFNQCTNKEMMLTRNVFERKAAVKNHETLQVLYKGRLLCQFSHKHI